MTRIFSILIAVFFLSVGHTASSQNDIAAVRSLWENQDLTTVLEMAHDGDIYAQFVLGFAYSEGQKVEQDDIQSESWFRKAADQGMPLAQYFLGNLYHSQKRYNEAFKWDLAAAEQGLVDAQLNLAFAYQNGQGVRQDFIAAVMWFAVLLALAFLGILLFYAVVLLEKIFAGWAEKPDT